jgi:hypothetical protein
MNEEADERTRLLGISNGALNGYVPQNAHGGSEHVLKHVDELPEKISTTRLLAIMLSVWLGSFLSALGMSVRCIFVWVHLRLRTDVCFKI